MSVVELDWPQQIPAEESEVVYLPDMANDTVAGVRNDLNRLTDKVTAGIAAAVLLFGILFYWMFIRMPDKSQEALKEERERTSLEVAKQLVPLSTEVAKLSAKISLAAPSATLDLPHEIRASIATNSEVGFRTVSALADVAKQKGIIAQEGAIRSVATELLKSVPTKTEGSEVQWDATLKLASYTSILVDPSTSATGKIELPPGERPVFYQTFSPANPKGLRFVMWGMVPMEQGSYIVPIQNYETLLNNTKKDPIAKGEAPAWAMVDFGGAPFEIDGFRIGHSIVSNAVIVYNGGPVILESVYFVNCTFQLKPTDRTRRFLTAFFSTPAVTLKQG